MFGGPSCWGTLVPLLRVPESCYCPVCMSVMQDAVRKEEPRLAAEAGHNNEEIGRRIRFKRKQKLLSMEELALRVGVSSRTIQDYELGKTGAWRKLREIGDALETPPNWFIEGDEPSSSAEELREISRQLDEMHQTVRDLVGAMRLLLDRHGEPAGRR